jgi:hypothetical protein
MGSAMERVKRRVSRHEPAMDDNGRATLPFFFAQHAERPRL